MAGVETRSIVENRVLGAADIGKGANSSVGKNLPGARLQQVFEATSGMGVRSGFGYVLQYAAKGRTHAILAVRGTRPEMAGKPDLVTDAYGVVTGFESLGLVHKGFKKTFESGLASLLRDDSVIRGADVVHCVGHSLGGAVATLMAGHYAGLGKKVKLYTFGSPRVGHLGTHNAFEKAIGIPNMYRVSHDLDPITMLGPFPYVHVNPSPTAERNYTCLSPHNTGVSMTNHDMNNYVSTVGDAESWSEVRGIANQYRLANAVQARMLLAEGNSSWVRTLCDKTLAMLFKLFDYALKALCSVVVYSATAIDLVAEVLTKGARMIHTVIGRQVETLLRYAAQWANVAIANEAAFTETVVRAILDAMMSRVRQAANVALSIAERNLRPMPLLLTGGLVLASAYAL